MQRRKSKMKGGGSCEAEDRVAEIYEQYASHVAAYALRRAGSTDAADAVAETFLVAWRRRDDVPEEPNTLPWLYGVARRVLSNQRRTHHRRRRLSNRLASEFAAQNVAPPALDDVEEFREVAFALRSLSDEDAELLRLTAWEALSPSDIAAVFGIAPGTARQRVSRARQRLRKQLAKDRAAGAIIESPCPGAVPLNKRIPAERLNGKTRREPSALRGGVRP